jgi:hypothetical protein
MPSNTALHRTADAADEFLWALHVKPTEAGQRKIMNKTGFFAQVYILVLILSLVVVACGGSPGNAPSSTSEAAVPPPASAETSGNSPTGGGVASKYESAWRTDFNLEITKALVAKDITGCGEYKYKASLEQSREYVVYCTVDGENWTAYLVWTGINDVMGPYPPDPSFE